MPHTPNRFTAADRRTYLWAMLVATAGDDITEARLTDAAYRAMRVWPDDLRDVERDEIRWAASQIVDLFTTPTETEGTE